MILPMNRQYKRYRRPQCKTVPVSGRPRALQNSVSDDAESPAWQFNLLDIDHSLWGWKTFKSNVEEIFFFLSTLEGMTWHDLKKQNGGRGKNGGTNHHAVQVDDLTKLARDRLRDLKLDEHNELFSLRVNNTRRIYGIKSNKVFKVLWYDEYHGNNSQAVYPTKNR